MAALLKCWFALVLCTRLKSSAVTRSVDEEKGQDLPQCLVKSSIPCQSLRYALNQSSTPNGIRVFLQGHSIQLTSVIQLHHHSNISIQGNCHLATVINCSEAWTTGSEGGAGFSFIGTNNLHLQCFQMLKCGVAEMLEDGSLDNVLPFRSAIYLRDTRDVVISRVNISYSNGVGITMFDVSGSANISGSHFWYNEHRESSSSGIFQNVYLGGGGINVNINKNETASLIDLVHRCI